MFWAQSGALPGSPSLAGPFLLLPDIWPLCPYTSRCTEPLGSVPWGIESPHPLMQSQLGLLRLRRARGPLPQLAEAEPPKGGRLSLSRLHHPGSEGHTLHKPGTWGVQGRQEAHLMQDSETWWVVGM